MFSIIIHPFTNFKKDEILRISEYSRENQIVLRELNNIYYFITISIISSTVPIHFSTSDK